MNHFCIPNVTAYVNVNATEAAVKNLVQNTNLTNLASNTDMPPNMPNAAVFGQMKDALI